MRVYDLVVIYRPATEDQALEQEIESVSNLVTEAGGDTVEINRWGKKPLGYEIGGERTGIYVVFKFRTESSVLAEMQKQLALNESVLRQRILLSQTVPVGSPEDDAETPRVGRERETDSGSEGE